MRHPAFNLRILNCVFLPLLLLVPFKDVAIKAQVPERGEDTYRMNNRQPDARFKADILVMVAHSDDETVIAGYCARAADQKLRVAIVWMNGTGQSMNGGLNLVGPEQSASLAAVREIEGVRSAAVLGISNAWNLGGSDTASQNPLESLEGNDHGQMLGRMVRLVRLTRPEVIITWLPEFVTGENHSDHQASGLLATEAFDLAGDPTAFPEQVSPATEPGRYMNRTEALRPWQPQKLYYFANPTHDDFFAGKGPEYNVTDISPARGVSYAEIAKRTVAEHKSQFSSTDKADWAPHPVRFILGKSLVGGAATDDVVAGVVPGGIPFQRPPGYIAPKHAQPVMELGDPWHYYRLFWQAHGLDSLFGLVPSELSLTRGTRLNIPLVVDNPLDTPIDVNLSVRAPEGWKVVPEAPAHLAAHESRYCLRVQAASPAEVRREWQQFTVTAESQGQTIGTVPLRVQLSQDSLPQ
jgi:LmbE family N-acetylglucosaminyl deacetylase